MAQVTIRLPPALTQLLACERQIEVCGRTVGEALDDLAHKVPGLALHLFDDAGALRRLVLCICNQEIIRDREGLDQILAPDDEITIINSVAGG